MHSSSTGTEPRTSRSMATAISNQTSGSRITSMIPMTDSQPSQSNTSPAQINERANAHVDADDKDPEDLLFDSLQTLYDYQPVALASAGAPYTYTHPKSTSSDAIEITVQTPDPDAANWSLHASSVWVASLQLARGVKFLQMHRHLQRLKSQGNEHEGLSLRKLRVLELGASAGIPSILISKLYRDVSVLATDYPDPNLIRTLMQNIEQNDAGGNCSAAPYAWGTDPRPLFILDSMGDAQPEFDVIIAADTLWNPDLHSVFIDTLRRTLRRDSGARVHLVAGLHTGPYTIDSFLRTVVKDGFRIVEVVEREISCTTTDGSDTLQTRDWDATRAEYEEEKDRRGWAIWIELCWGDVS